MNGLEKITYDPDAPVDPRVEALVTELIGRVADKWTMLVLEELEDHGTCRFTELARLVPGISQKMLTQTLRAMERDGLVTRTVHPVVPPKVEYCLTALGHSLGAGVDKFLLVARQIPDDGVQLGKRNSEGGRRVGAHGAKI